MRHSLRFFLQQNAYVVFVIRCCLLFLSYRYNLFEAAPQTWFADFQSDSEQLVWLQFLTSPHPIGWGDGLCAQVVCLETTGCVCHLPYWSCAGSQVVLLQWLAKLLPMTLEWAHHYQAGLTALLTALLLQQVSNGLRFWLFCCACFAPWWIVIARNLYWQVWLWLAMLQAACCFVGMWRQNKRIWAAIALLMLGLIAVFRCLAGYEFYWNISATILLLCFAFLPHRSIATRWSAVLLLALTLLVAFATAVVVHGMKRAEHWQDGLHAIYMDAKKRSFDLPNIGPGYQKSHMQSRLQVLVRYHLFWEHGWLPWLEHWLPCLNAPTKILLWQLFAQAQGNLWHMLYLLYNEANQGSGQHLLLWSILFASSHGFLFLICCMAGGYMLHRRDRSRQLVMLALLAYGISIGWLVLMKSHAALHSHLDPITWMIPFLPTLLACMYRLIVLEQSCNALSD